MKSCKHFGCKFRNDLSTGGCNIIPSSDLDICKHYRPDTDSREKALCNIASRLCNLGHNDIANEIKLCLVSIDEESK